MKTNTILLIIFYCSFFCITMVWGQATDTPTSTPTNTPTATATYTNTPSPTNTFTPQAYPWGMISYQQIEDKFLRNFEDDTMDGDLNLSAGHSYRIAGTPLPNGGMGYWVDQGDSIETKAGTFDIYDNGSSVTSATMEAQGFWAFYENRTAQLLHAPGKGLYIHSTATPFPYGIYMSEQSCSDYAFYNASPAQLYNAGDIISSATIESATFEVGNKINFTDTGVQLYNYSGNLTYKDTQGIANIGQETNNSSFRINADADPDSADVTLFFGSGSSKQLHWDGDPVGAKEFLLTDKLHINGDLILGATAASKAQVSHLIYSATSASLAVRTSPPSTEDDYISITHNLGDYGLICGLWIMPATGEYVDYWINGEGCLTAVQYSENEIRVYNDGDAAVKARVDVIMGSR